MKDDEEAVGYGRPPVATRFKPGQSGNPSGRRKVQKSFLQEAAEVFELPVETSGACGRKRVTSAKAMFRRLARRAILGNRAAMQRMVEVILTLEAEAGAAAQTQEVNVEEIIARTAKLLKLSPEALRSGYRGPQPKAERPDPELIAKERELRKDYAKRGIYYDD